MLVFPLVVSPHLALTTHEGAAGVLTAQPRLAVNSFLVCQKLYDIPELQAAVLEQTHSVEDDVPSGLVLGSVRLPLQPLLPHQRGQLDGLSLVFPPHVVPAAGLVTVQLVTVGAGLHVALVLQQLVDLDEVSVAAPKPAHVTRDALVKVDSLHVFRQKFLLCKSFTTGVTDVLEGVEVSVVYVTADFTSLLGPEVTVSTLEDGDVLAILVLPLLISTPLVG